MFIYEDGLPVRYIANNPDPVINAAVEEHMLNWFRSLPGQSRVRLGKIGIMQGQEPNLKRLDNE